MVTSCQHVICPAGMRACMALAMVCALRNHMQRTVNLVVTPVQACVDVSGFMSACFISFCKLLVCLGNCAEGFA